MLLACALLTLGSVVSAQSSPSRVSPRGAEERPAAEVFVPRSAGLFAVSLESRALRKLGATTVTRPWLVGSQVWDPLRERLVVVRDDGTTGNLHVVDPFGEANEQVTFGLGLNYRAMAYDPVRDLIWASKGFGLYVIDPTTFEQVYVQFLQFFINGMAVDAASGVVYVATPLRLYRFGPSGFQFELVANLSSSVEDLTWDAEMDSLLATSVSGGVRRLVEIDMDTGRLIPLTELDFQARRPVVIDGELAVAVGSRLDRVDIATGASESLRIYVATSLGDLAFDPASQAVLGVDSASGHLCRVDRFSAQVSFGPFVVDGGVDGLAFDPQRGELLAALGDVLYTLDPISGALEQVATLPIGDLRGLAFDAATRTVYGVAPDGAGLAGQLVSVDLASGVASMQAANVGRAGGLSFDSRRKRLAYQQFGSQLVSLDPVSLGQDVLNSAGVAGSFGMAYDPISSQLLTVAGPGLRAIDPRTGVATLMGGSGLPAMDDVEYDASSGVLHAMDGATYYRIDPDTGDATRANAGRVLRNIAAGDGGLYGVEQDRLYFLDPSRPFDAQSLGRLPWSPRDLAFDPATGTLWATVVDLGLAQIDPFDLALLRVIDSRTWGLAQVAWDAREGSLLLGLNDQLTELDPATLTEKPLGVFQVAGFGLTLRN